MQVYITRLLLKTLSTMRAFDKPIGKLRSDGTYITYRTKKTFFRKYNGFAISYAVLKGLIEKGCNKIVIVYEANNEQTLYKTTPENFINNGVIHKDKVLDYQRVLSLDQFNIPTNGDLQIFTKRQKQELLKTGSN